MPKLTREDLIGKQVELSIGEPWDFESSDGKNRLLGLIKGISLPEAKNSWVYIKATSFEINNIIIDQVVGDARHVGYDTIQELLAGKEAICNFSYKKNGEKICEADLVKEINEDWFNSAENKGWLIGGVKLID